MRVIKKIIARDDLISKIPGIIPSIKDSWKLPSFIKDCSNIEGEVFFDFDEALKKIDDYGLKSSSLVYEGIFADFISDFKYDENGNYGLIPSDIIIPLLKDENNNIVHITDYTDLYVNIPVTDSFLENVSIKDRDKYDTYFDLSYPVRKQDPHYEYNNEANRYGIYSGSNDNKIEIKILSYKTLSKWYFFAKKRENILKSHNNKKEYSNYIEYNKNENLKEDELYYNLEQLYISRGGDYMYNWMKNNCFLAFTIPFKYSSEWKTSYLYYSQAIKWLKWFEEKDSKYYDSETGKEKKCKDEENCYECNEYVRLGGHELYVLLKEWVENSTSEININNTNSASLNLYINFQTSIDDLGEMSIFSSKWENDVDYHNTLSDDEMEEGSEGGTIVYLPYKTDEETGKITVINDTVMIKNGNHTGYKHNDFYENTFNEDDWINTYTNYYTNERPEEFATSAISAYAYSSLYNEVVYNPSENPEMFKKYISPIMIKFVLINNRTYFVIDGKYVEMCYESSSIANLDLKSKSKLRIYKDGDLEYAVLNGNRYYVEVDKNGIERVYFLKNYNCKDEGCAVNSNVSYIMFNKNLCLINDDGSTVIYDGHNENVYYTLDGIFELDGKTYYIKNDASGYKIVKQYESYEDDGKVYYYFEEISLDDLVDKSIDSIKFEIISGNPMVVVEYNYYVNYTNKITGITDSKLELLRRREITTDELGNELPGYFKSVIDYDKIENEYNSNANRYYTDVSANVPDEDYSLENDKGQYYNSPYEGCTLDILYRVGEVSNLVYDTYLSTGETQYFIGNIIDNIEFYYTDVDLNRVDDFSPDRKFEAKDDDALSVIKECEEAKNNYSGNSFLCSKMMCNITYYMGAVLKKVDDKYEIVKQYHTGIKYVDSAFVTLENCLYYLNDGSKFVVKYYYLDPFKYSTYNQDDKISSTMMMSKFEVEPMIFYYKKGYSKSEEIFAVDNTGNCEDNVGKNSINLTLSAITKIDANDDKTTLEFKNKSIFDRWEGDYNFIASPVYRNEFNIGNSLPQIIEGNIYIDRGINAAFEKHLKLQEVKTMEALTNFGNNWFKIEDNG